jgi:hypothetical protein
LNCTKDLFVNQKTHNSVLRARLSHSNITVSVVLIRNFAVSASLSLSRTVGDARLGSDGFGGNGDALASLAPLFVGESADLFHLARRLDGNGEKDWRRTDMVRFAGK